MAHGTLEPQAFVASLPAVSRKGVVEWPFSPQVEQSSTVGALGRLSSDFGVLTQGGHGRARAVAFRRTVVCVAGASLAAVAVIAAVGRDGTAAAGRPVLVEQGAPSDVAAQIIASAQGFNREVDDLVPHDDPPAPADTRLEANYPQLAESIVKHGRGVLYRLLHGPPEDVTEGIPMPVDDEEPPDADGLDEDAGGEPPQTTPQPDPSADQGGVAEAIIAGSNTAREELLADADTNGLPNIRWHGSATIS